MKLLLQSHLDQLRRNAIARSNNPAGHDPKPVVKLFLPWGSATWLVTEIEEEDQYDMILFGLADLGFGAPELGSFSLHEISSVTRFGLGLERDLHFTATKPLSEYAAEARSAGKITV